ncbi:hypothetical protein ACPYO6_13560 [Georgenia sp. Z1344]|uniref:hypothetical protein n=1 Tax=Georgenia sp. Z1344 TaxID=3416706 RepID=UPI003CF2A60C
MRRRIITVAAVAGLGIVGVGGVAVAASLGSEDAPEQPVAAGDDSGTGDETDAPDDAPDGDTPPSGLPALPEGLLDQLPDDLADQLPDDLGDQLPEGLDDLEGLEGELPSELEDGGMAALTESMQPMIDAALEGLELLDLGPGELLAELSSGATIGELATEQGVDPEELVQLGLGPVDEEIDAAVERGDVTRAEADEARAELETMLRTVIEEGPEAAGLPGPGAFPHGDQPDAPTT